MRAAIAKTKTSQSGSRQFLKKEEKEKRPFLAFSGRT
jgi:hypothetical protein